MLDTKALTGESVPRSIRKRDEALSGCINQSGLLTLKVTKSFGESTVSKITDLVENASARKAPTENFITTFARYYTPVVVGMAAVLAIIPPLVLGGGWSEWLRRGFCVPDRFLPVCIGHFHSPDLLRWYRCCIQARCAGKGQQLSGGTEQSERGGL